MFVDLVGMGSGSFIDLGFFGFEVSMFVELCATLWFQILVNVLTNLWLCLRAFGYT